MRQLNGSFEKKSLAILMRQKSEWDDTRLRSFLLLGTVWILGVRARYGQNLMVSGCGGYDHRVHRVGGDALCRQEAGDSGGREGGVRSDRNRSRGTGPYAR